MSDKIMEKELHKIIERRSTGKTSFTEFLEELSKIGIIQYDVDVATGQATYMGEYSELKTEPQVNFVISNHFNRNQALQIIANITLPFLDFLREIANAGITTYNVNIIEKKAIYAGIVNSHFFSAENIPFFSNSSGIISTLHRNNVLNFLHIMGVEFFYDCFF